MPQNSVASLNEVLNDLPSKSSVSVHEEKSKEDAVVEPKGSVQINVQLNKTEMAVQKKGEASVVEVSEQASSQVSEMEKILASTRSKMFKRS